MGFFEFIFADTNIIEKIVWIIFLLFLCFIVFGAFYSKFSPTMKKLEDDKNEEEKLIIETYGLKPDNIKSWICFGFQSGVLFLTKENKLVLVKIEDMKYLKAKEIPFEDILEISAEIKVKERNVMKIISIVPTFSNYKIVNGVSMRIITVNESINLSLDTDIKGEYTLQRMKFTNEHKGWTWEKTIGEVNRLKLLIEREMNSNN